MTKKEVLTYGDVLAGCSRIANQIQEDGKKYSGVYPILKGGYHVAVRIASALSLPMLTEPTLDCLIVDDIINSGRTLDGVLADIPKIWDVDFAVLVKKTSNPEIVKKINYSGIVVEVSKWVEFPWEPAQEDVESLVSRQLEVIGENPSRAGLVDTPRRVVKSWNEFYRGYDKEQKPKITVFDNGDDGVFYDQMITDTGDFVSRCEHHMELFFGDYVFAYIPHPKGKVLGLSKIARIVDYHSARLQIQERLVADIVNDVWDALCSDGGGEPLGVGLVMEAMHMCKVARGVKKKGKMQTSHLRGNFKERGETRNEFMNVVNRALQNSAW